MSNNSLEQALALYEEQWLASLPSDEDLDPVYTPSPRFERRMARLFLQQQKPYYSYVNRSWKRAVLAVVFVLMLFAASMSVSAIREPTIHFVIEVYEKFSSLFLQTAETSAEWVMYSPSSLPEGYILISEEQLADIIVRRYRNDEGAIIFFSKAICTA